MLVEKSIKEALMDYAKGRKVVVLQFDAKGRIDANLLSDFFEDENNKYLVDVPAVIDPEFESDVQGMMKGSEMIVSNEADADPEPIESKTEEFDSMEPYDGEILPPPLETPELEKEEMIPAEKSKREIVLELKEQGLTAKEIAVRTGMNYGTVYYHYSGQKKEASAESGKKKVTSGHNKDRHLCKTCQYRMGQYGKVRAMNCNYIEIEGRSRGCSVEDCNVYKKGKRIKGKGEKD